ncbi:unnamed protein product [marine sediment metagenome]|uniref:Uncharacterized protein n=1 Tax=marine sediment metagenome TaxID=412755 RepID=X1DGB8_9ZZZZ
MARYAYIAGSQDDALTIIDITDPTNPIHVGAIVGAGFPNFLNFPYGVAVVGIGIPDCNSPNTIPWKRHKRA